MSKTSAFHKNLQRGALIKKSAAKRAAIKAIAKNKDSSPEEVFEAYQKLNELPRDGNPIRYRNRCRICGRPHAVYRKLGMCRICFRKLASEGLLPGVTKSSW